MVMLTQPEAIQTDTPFWHAALHHIQIIDSQRLDFFLKRPEPELIRFLSAQGSLLMLSKAQLNAETSPGVEARPARTGSYRYKEKKLGQYILYEPVEKHWRKTPEFSELQKF